MKRVMYVIPGWTKNTSKWDILIEKLQASGHTVKKLGIPGLQEKLTKPFTIYDYVDWLHSQFSLHSEKITLVGHSSGGKLALAYALSYPDRVKQLILIDCSALDNGDPMRQAKKMANKTITHIKTIVSKKHKKINEDFDPIARLTIKNLSSINLEADLKNVSCPTLIIWGQHDKVTPLEDGKFINLSIPDSKLFVIYNARHSPQFTHPEEVCEIIEKNIT